MKGIQNKEQVGQQAALLTCQDCHQPFVAQWKWEKLVNGEKYFSLDCFFICPVCNTEHMYGLEQAANFSELVDGAEHTRRYIDSLTSWQGADGFQTGFAN